MMPTIIRINFKLIIYNHICKYILKNNISIYIPTYRYKIHQKANIHAYMYNYLILG